MASRFEDGVVNICLSVAAWGDKNVELLARFSFASLLASGNLPALARDNAITVHIATSYADYQKLNAMPVIARLAEHCTIAWDWFEDLDLGDGPSNTDARKYGFLTLLQNLAMVRAGEHDALIFNYADFVWANGALPGAVRLLGDDVDAVLGFCMPVDLQVGKAALEGWRSGDTIDVTPRALADICLSSLHREASYRYWDAPSFTHFPSYLLFRVGEDGAVVRAYHQTALVLRVKRDDAHYKRGITNGTLDGHYTSEIAKNGKVVHAVDSDDVMVFSLHDTHVDSRMRGGNRNAILRRFVGDRADPQQIKFSETALRIKRQVSDEAQWHDVEVTSSRLLMHARSASGRS